MKNKDSETTLSLLLLGTPRLEIGGEVVEIDTRKAIAILAYVAVQREPTTREFLAAMLWPELDQSRARAALRRTLSAMRRSIGRRYLDISRESVGLNEQAAIQVDVWAFEELAGREEPATLGQLQAAADLYRADFMTGFTLRDSPAFDEWQYYQGQNYRRELAGVLRRMIARLEAAGDWKQAIGVARRWLAQDPLHEAVQRALMRLYALAGERNKALRQYERCCAVLADELGVEPLAETTQLADQIRQNKLKPQQSPPLPITIPAAQPDPAGTPAEWPLVGRGQEWQALWARYRETGPAGALAVIEGEAGIGKTRLAGEFLAAVAAQGAVTVQVRCYRGESDVAYGPLVEGARDLLARPEAVARLESLPGHWLAEVSRLLPEVRTLHPDVPSPLPAEDISAQGRLYAAFGALLKTLCAGPRTGVFMIDDVQWAHEATLDLLAYLVRRGSDGRLLFLLAWRDADLPWDHPLRSLLAECKRAGRATHIFLNRFTQAEIDTLVAAVSGNSAEKDLGARLYQETEGNPYFAVEYLAALAQLQGPEWPMPGSVRDLLRSRLAGLSQMETQLLQAAAVIGRSFPYELWQAASGRSLEEAVAALEQLLQQGLVQEMRGGELAYDFSHEKLRDLVLAETSMARRRLLHLRVAEAILAQTRKPERMGPLAAQVGHHFEQAARPEQAAGYYFQAGRHAQAVFANREAVALYRKALSLGDDFAEAGEMSLHERLGDCLALLGEYGAAVAHYRQAVAQAPQAGRAPLERKLGDIYHLRGKWRKAESHFAAALDLLGDGRSEAEQATVLAAWSRTVLRQGEQERALVLAERALDLAGQAGDGRALAQAHNARGMLARQEGDLELAEYHLEQSLALAERLNHPGAQTAALNNLALVYQAQGETGRALDTLNRALQLCVKQGDRHREAAIYNNLADVLHAAGREAEAMEHLKQGVAIYAEIGNEDGRWQPEIWKLTTW